MGVRYWFPDEFHSDAERVKHCALAHEQYRLTFYCHYWLLGAGRYNEDNYSTEHQRIADRERLKQGWTLNTLVEAHAEFTSKPVKRTAFEPVEQKPEKDDKPKKGVLFSKPASGNWTFNPPPTIERDWTETFPDEEKRAGYFKEIQGKIRNAKGSMRKAIGGAFETPINRWADKHGDKLGENS